MTKGQKEIYDVGRAAVLLIFGPGRAPIDGAVPYDVASTISMLCVTQKAKTNNRDYLPVGRRGGSNANQKRRKETDATLHN